MGKKERTEAAENKHYRTNSKFNYTFEFNYTSQWLRTPPIENPGERSHFGGYTMVSIKLISWHYLKDYKVDPPAKNSREDP